MCEAGFFEVRDPVTGKLLFKFNPATDEIEVVNRGERVIIALAELRRRLSPAEIHQNRILPLKC
jgi:hypothetical protein